MDFTDLFKKDKKSKQKKKFRCQKSRFKRLKTKSNKMRQETRIDRKINTYHILKMLKKYKPLNLKKIIFDPSGLKSKIVICVILKESIDEIKTAKEDTIHCYDFRELLLDPKVKFLSLSEADKLLHQKYVERNSVLRSKKRLKTEKHYKCMNIFEKKIVSLTSKDYCKLRSNKKLSDAKKQNKDKKGGCRFRDVL